MTTMTNCGTGCHIGSRPMLACILMYADDLVFSALHGVHNRN